jgi:hypothetical protein
MQQTLQNRRRTINIFGFSNFETRTEGNSKQSKIFLDFFKYQTENKKQRKTKLEN